MLDILCLTEISQYIYHYDNHVAFVLGFNVTSASDRVSLGIIDRSLKSESFNASRREPYLILRYMYIFGRSSFDPRVNILATFMMSRRNGPHVPYIGDRDELLTAIDRYGSPEVLTSRLVEMNHEIISNIDEKMDRLREMARNKKRGRCNDCGSCRRCRSNIEAESRYEMSKKDKKSSSMASYSEIPSWSEYDPFIDRNIGASENVIVDKSREDDHREIVKPKIPEDSSTRDTIVATILFTAAFAICIILAKR